MTSEGIFNRRRRVRPGSFSVLRRVIPHAGIWGTTFAVISSTVGQGQCVGFCAVYAGWISYLVVSAATVLTVLVIAAQLLLAS